MSDCVKTVILTRPKRVAESFARDLKQQGFRGQILFSPLIEIEPTGCTPDYSNITGVIFTSQHAVHLAPVQNLPAWCVGSQTAAAAKAAGWEAKPAGGDVDHLFKQICADAPHGRLLHLSGKETRGNLVERLNLSGISAEQTVLYQQVRRALSAEATACLKGEKNVLVPLFSPNSARYFSEDIPEEVEATVVVMSEAIQNALVNPGSLKIIRAHEVSAHAVINAILEA